MKELEKQRIVIENKFKKNKKDFTLTLTHKSCYISEEVLEFLAKKYNYTLVNEIVKPKETIYVWRKAK